MMRAYPLRFGIKTAPQQASHDGILEVWRAADALSTFEHAWLNDHVTSLGDDSTIPYLEAWTLLAALASQTSRLRIGVMVTANTFRHPALLAKMAVTIDIISHGRLNLGIGTGWSEQEHQAYGIPLPPPGERVQRLDEACTLITRLWSEAGVNFAGRYYQLHTAYCEPRPVQKPYPAIAIGAEGPRTLHVVARHAQIWDCSVATPDEYQEKSRLLDKACETIGRNAAEIERSRHISVDPADLNAAYTETRSFIEVGATHIIYHVPVPTSQGTLQRLAEEVAEPLRAAYQAPR